MSEKRLDAKNRWRNVVVAFRMSPEEAQELNVKVSLSGLSKQDYIIQCLLKHEIRVVGGMKVAKKVQVHLDTILEELQTLDESDRGILSALYKKNLKAGLAVIGNVTIGGAVERVVQFADKVSSLADNGAKMVIVPMDNISEIATIPTTVLSKCDVPFYNNAQVLLQKAMV